MAYRVRITETSLPQLFVRYRNDWDGSWTTRRAADAKTWMTKRGAQKWIDERPGVAAAVEEEP